MGESDKGEMSGTDGEPSPKRTSIGARRSPDAAAAILSAARDILAEAGYSGFSIEAVARRAGAGKPTVYRWWPTKADLFIAVYGNEKEAFVPVPDTGDLHRDLVEITTALFRFWRANPAGATLKGLIAEAQGSPAALSVLKGKFLPERTTAIRSVFRHALARGELARADIEPRVELWIGYIWLHLLTDRLDPGAAAIGAAMAPLATPLTPP